MLKCAVFFALVALSCAATIPTWGEVEYGVNPREYVSPVWKFFAKQYPMHFGQEIPLSYYYQQHLKNFYPLGQEFSVPRVTPYSYYHWIKNVLPFEGQNIETPVYPVGREYPVSGIVPMELYNWIKNVLPIEEQYKFSQIPLSYFYQQYLKELYPFGHQYAVTEPTPIEFYNWIKNVLPYYQPGHLAGKFAGYPGFLETMYNKYPYSTYPYGQYPLYGTNPISVY